MSGSQIAPLAPGQSDPEQLRVAINDILAILQGKRSDLVTLSVPACVVTLEGQNQTIPNGTGDPLITKIVFNYEFTDTDNMWVVGTPDRITIRTPGIYSCAGAASWIGSFAESAHVFVIARHSNNDPVGGAGHSVNHPTTAIYHEGMNVALIIPLIAGDYVFLRCTQDSGGNQQVEYGARLSVVRIG